MSEHKPWHHRYRRHLRWSGLGLVLLLVIIQLMGQLHWLPAPALQLQPGLLPVIHVEDGDTIQVQEPDGSKPVIRMIGVDTPETVKPNTPVQCGGPEASKHTKAVMAGAKVRLAPDPDDSDTDKYGRLLRYVYLEDGTLYNEQLVQQGYGFAYTVFNFTKLNQFKADQAAAMTAGNGLWGLCNVNSSSQILQTAGPKA
jgi:micrococcal nuclease